MFDAWVGRDILLARAGGENGDLQSWIKITHPG
jgi:hypothetical protein